LTLMKGENNQMKRVDSNNHGSDLMAVMHWSRGEARSYN
jgi:hypothetical protein